MITLIKRILAAITLVFAATGPLAAGTTRYNIEPDGQYTYFPSPWLAEFPGCSPSSECSFGISGSFDIVVDVDSDIARLADVELALTGNDEAQQIALSSLVTSTGVSEWLENRSFRDLQVLGPFTIYADDRLPNLQLTDFLEGTVSLSGGFDRRLVDGDGLDFQFTAVAVPEPSTLFLGLLGLAGFFVFGARRFRF